MFGGGIEIIIDEVTAASSNLVKINAIVHWDFAVTQPGAIARALDIVTA
jgi:hypothetical protein